MVEHLKPGAGRISGNEYQIWLGVKLILDWFNKFESEPNESVWLRTEIGVKKYGIFDDIQLFQEGKYYFIQAKSTIQMKGETISEDNLNNSKDVLSIEKMYNSYCLIKANIGLETNFKLIIYHNKTITGILKDCIESYSFSNSFVKGSARNVDRKELRTILLKKCDSPEDFVDFLQRISFQKLDNPEVEVYKSIPPHTRDIISFLYNQVENNAKFEFDGDSKRIFFSNIKLFINDPTNNDNLFPKCFLIDEWFKEKDILSLKQEKIRQLKVDKVIEFNNEGPNIKFITYNGNTIDCFLIEPQTSQKKVGSIQLWVGENIHKFNGEFNFRIVKNTADNRFIRQLPENFVI